MIKTYVKSNFCGFSLTYGPPLTCRTMFPLLAQQGGASCTEL